MTNPLALRHLPRVPRMLAALLVVMLMAAACGDDDSTEATSATTSPPSTATSTSTSTTSTTTTSAPVADPTTSTSTPAADDEACAIIGDGGSPMLTSGATDTEILAALGPAWTATRDDAYLVDVEGFTYDCGGETIFYGAWVVGEAEVFSFAASDHPSFVDPAGVGPGQPLADAIASHGGSAVLNVSELEQREFATFADGGAPGWSYRVGSNSGGFAGIYPDPQAAYPETSTFTADAIISSVWWNPDRATP